MLITMYIILKAANFGPRDLGSAANVDGLQAPHRRISSCAVPLKFLVPAGAVHMRNGGEEIYARKKAGCGPKPSSRFLFLTGLKLVRREVVQYSLRSWRDRFLLCRPKECCS